jgi:hypothetical protein
VAISIPITRAVKLSGYSTGRFYWNIQRGVIKVSASDDHRRSISIEEMGRLLRQEAQQLEAARRDHERRDSEFREFVKQTEAAARENAKRKSAA